jgi:hypothetical protein
VSEWRNFVTDGLLFVVFIELFEIGKWVFTDGWSGVLKFHLRLSRRFLAHCIGLLYGGAIFGIVSAWGWRVFRDAPPTVLGIVVVPLLVAIPFRPFLRNLFRDDDVILPLKPKELPFHQ